MFVFLETTPEVMECLPVIFKFKSYNSSMKIWRWVLGLETYRCANLLQSFLVELEITCLIPDPC